MQGVPLQFSDEKDRARFRHLEQLPGVELYHAHISRYAFEPLWNVRIVNCVPGSPID